MKQVWLIFLLLFGASEVGANESIDIKKLRQQYYAAVQSADATEKLYKELKRNAKPSPLIVAYTGSLEALRAKHALNPYNKLQYLKEADNTMKRAVKADPDNIEIRFLRFSYQYYVPEFLGYSENKEEDVKSIVALIKAGNFAQADKSLVQNVVRFLEETKSVQKEELRQLKQLTGA
jgi:hypothetical protein